MVETSCTGVSEPSETQRVNTDSPGREKSINKQTGEKYLRNLPTLSDLKAQLKTFLFQQAFPQI